MNYRAKIGPEYEVSDDEMPEVVIAHIKPTGPKAAQKKIRTEAITREMEVAPVAIQRE
jgi:hypothetical protein